MQQSTHYIVRKLHLAAGLSSQLDALAREAGRLYTLTVVTFWRLVRKQGVWLSATSMQKLIRSDRLHSQSTQAIIQTFYASLESWRKRRKIDVTAKPPHRRKGYFKVIWKASAMCLTDGQLRLSNGKGREPVVLPWQWACPKQVEIGWNGTGYELRATYGVAVTAPPQGTGTAAVDLGEIHPVTVCAGTTGTIYNGRSLRSVRRYQNKLKAKLDHKLSKLKKRSRRWKRLKRSKAKQQRTLNNQIRDALHKITRHVVSTLHASGVQTLVIGDVRDIRQDLDYGKRTNQKLHQWTCGKVRAYLTYKWEAMGGTVALQNEAYTSKTCPLCDTINAPKGRNFHCRACGFHAHRDLVGALNILKKYLGYGPVVGDMAPPSGVRFHAHLPCSSDRKDAT